MVTWGDPRRGGDSSAVQEQLKNVQQIQATRAQKAPVGGPSVLEWVSYSGEIDLNPKP